MCGIQEGWRCPNCGAINSPILMQCLCGGVPRTTCITFDPAQGITEYTWVQCENCHSTRRIDEACQVCNGTSKNSTGDEGE